MGSEPSKLSNSSSSQPIDHRHLGTITKTTFAGCSSQQTCFQRVFHFGDPLSFNEHFHRVQTRMKRFPNHQHILRIIKVHKQEVQELCSYTGKVKVHFECYEADVNTLLERKIKEKIHFSQEEIVIFLKRVTQAIITLHDNGLKCGHIDGQSILICTNNNRQQEKDYIKSDRTHTWDNFDIKVLDGILLIHNGNIYHRILSLIQQVKHEKYQTQKDSLMSNLYLSPEVLQDLKNNNLQPTSAFSPKCDVFSLGMLAVSMCCLQKLDCYYNFHPNKLSIDYESLIYRISRMVYSTELKKLLAQMIQYDQGQRIGLVTLYQKLNRLGGWDNQSNSSRKLTTRPSQRNLGRARSSSTRILSDILMSTHSSRKQDMIFKNIQGVATSNNSSLKSKNKSSTISMKSQQDNPHKGLNGSQFSNYHSSSLMSRMSQRKEITYHNKGPEQIINVVRTSQMRLKKDESDGDSNVNLLKNIVKRKIAAQEVHQLKYDSKPKDNIKLQMPHAKTQRPSLPANTSIKKFFTQENHNNNQSQIALNQNKENKQVLVNRVSYMDRLKSFHTSQIQKLTHLRERQREVVQKKSQDEQLGSFANRQYQKIEVRCEVPSLFNEKNSSRLDTSQPSEDFSSISETQSMRSQQKKKWKMNEQSLIKNYPLESQEYKIYKEFKNSSDNKTSNYVSFDQPKKIQNKEYFQDDLNLESSIRKNSFMQSHGVESFNAREQDSSQILISTNPLEMLGTSNAKPTPMKPFELLNGDYEKSKTQTFENLGLFRETQSVEKVIGRQVFCASYRKINLFEQRHSGDKKLQYDNRYQTEQLQKLYDNCAGGPCLERKPFCKSKSRRVLNAYSQEDEQLRQSFDGSHNKQRVTFQYRNESPSVSEQIKMSLNNMYKTTQSFNSSQQKNKSGQKDQLICRLGNSVNKHYEKVSLGNGYLYQGQRNEANQMDGNGALYDKQNKLLYSGSWKNSRYHGFGELHNYQAKENKSGTVTHLNLTQTPWQKYEGEFLNGSLNGFGIVYYPNGQKFSGCSVNGVFEGYGCFYDKQGKMISGLWKNNYFVKC